MLRLLLIAACGLLPLVRGQISDADREIILKTHNDLRASLPNAQAGLHAGNMVKMYWDDDLERSAQKWTDTCPMYHDTNAQRKKATGLGMMVGQNMAWGYGTWARAVKGWYNEVFDFSFGKGPKKKGDVVGHFTQVVQGWATHVGCGFKKCPGTKYVRYYTCNYAYGQRNYKTPFKPGKPCSGCPKFCKNGLCDCGAKALCKNGGIINPTTCKCTCKKPWSGVDCTGKSCPKKDHPYCSTGWKNGIAKHGFCTKYSNVPTYCPYACGVC